MIKALYTQTKANFSGQYYQLDNASLEPKPLQSTLPLLIGGGGEKVTLKITAQHADSWNVWGTVDTLKHKMSVLDKHCATFKRDPKEIHRTAVALLFMNDDKAFIDKMKATPMDMATIIGSVDEVAEIIKEYEQIGVDELIVPDFTLGPMPQKLETLDTFISKVAGRS